MTIDELLSNGVGGASADRIKIAYQQGREDAIDELLSKCEQYNYTCNSREFAKIIREQLKEQKNEYNK